MRKSGVESARHRTLNSAEYRREQNTAALNLVGCGGATVARLRCGQWAAGSGLGENGVEDEHVSEGGSGQAVTGKRGAVEIIPLRRLAGILRV